MAESDQDSEKASTESKVEQSSESSSKDAATTNTKTDEKSPERSAEDASTGSSKEKRASKRSQDGEEKESRKSKRDRAKSAGKVVKAGSDAVRNRIATAVWLIAVLCAVVLAVGALLIALSANEKNSVVKFVIDAADQLDLGLFSRKNGIFHFTKSGADVKNALVNWGIAAIVYLVVGKIIDRLIRP